ncbi:MAG: histidine kinase, partial [Micrococcaceae bacterium]|nr:histidine kinase [Micrococcaceae bacterium]
LHDTVAHHVSAIVIAAQSGQVLARSATGEGALEALETIEQEAAGALAEMRTIVGALRGRGGPSPLAPSRGVAEIKDLAVSGEGALEIQVSLAGDLAGLAPGVEAALFRVAQEAVTNARRHARAAKLVRVTVSGGIFEVELCVVDDGLRAVARAPGYGMTGMAERIALLGGTLEAGPGATSGWLVSVVLPRTGRR